MSTLTYDRIKEGFVRALESAGLVSLDTGRHKTLIELCDAHTEAVRKFLTEETPEAVAQAPKADPTVGANEVAAWLGDVELAKDWKFYQVPTTHHGAGRAVFAHYDVESGTPIAGVVHVKLVTPDNHLLDLQFKPADGEESFKALVASTIEMYGKEDEHIEPVVESEVSNADGQ